MSDIKPVFFNCPEHGRVKGVLCVQCRAKRAKANLQAVLKEGPGPKKNDPSPMSIKYRAYLLRKRRREPG